MGSGLGSGLGFGFESASRRLRGRRAPIRSARASSRERARPARDAPGSSLGLGPGWVLGWDWDLGECRVGTRARVGARAWVGLLGSG